LLELLEQREREAISLAPRLQPGGKVLQMIPEPFPMVFLIRLPTKTVRNGSLSIPVFYCRVKPRC